MREGANHASMHCREYCREAPVIGLREPYIPGARHRVDEKLARIIFDSISDGVFTVDKECIITSFNSSAERITGFSAREAMGKHCFEIFRTEVCHQRCALRETLHNKDSVENARVTIITQQGREVPITVTTTILRDDSGGVIGAVEFFRDLSEVENLRHALHQVKSLEGIVSNSPKMRRVMQTLPSIAESQCNVLIQGPSGSGKELFAHMIHNLSPRRFGPYIKINCAALPATLLESELFGYVKGAFTDAKRDKPGQFCLANGGTLLLDEISEMDVSLQVKLLRVLNNGEYQPLGSIKPLHTDARILAATNADLKSAIREKRFREDLLYRINVVTIDLPPLRERVEDLPFLLDFFLQKLGKKFHRPNKKVSPEILGVFRRYPFPGNVRELENIVEHAFVMSQKEEIRPEHLPADVLAGSAASGPSPRPADDEREVILEALRRHGGNRNSVSGELGMHRSTLWRKLKTLGIEPLSERNGKRADAP
jgi:PAS domain S-box-containing protein